MRKGTRTVLVGHGDVSHRRIGTRRQVSCSLLEYLGVAPWQDGVGKRLRLRRDRAGRLQLKSDDPGSSYLQVWDDADGDVGFVCRRGLRQLLGYRPRPGMRFTVTVLP